MAKKVETRMVLREMTKDDIQVVGNNRAIKGTLKWAIPLAVIFLFIVGFESIRNETDTILSKVALGGLVLTVIAWYFYITSKGIKYWKELKDKPQPVKLDRKGNYID